MLTTRNLDSIKRLPSDSRSEQTVKRTAKIEVESNCNFDRSLFIFIDSFI